MRRFQNLTIKRKLVLIIMLTSGFTVLLASAAFVIKDVILFSYSVTHHLSSLTQVVGKNSVGALAFNDQYTAEKNLASLKAMPYVFSAVIYDKDGDVFATYYRHDSGKKVSPPEYEDIIRGFEKHSKKKEKDCQLCGHYFKGDYLFLFNGISLEDEMIGTIFIQYDKNEMFLGMKHGSFILAIILLISFFVALVLSNYLQHFISEPIVHLVQTARTISQRKDYSVRAEKCSLYQDELGVLIDGFNEMLTEIQTQENKIKKHRENELKMHQEYLGA